MNHLRSFHRVAAHLWAPHRAHRLAGCFVAGTILAAGSAAAAGVPRSDRVPAPHPVSTPAAAPIRGVDSMWVWRDRPAGNLATAAQDLGIDRVFLFVGKSSASGDANIARSVRLLQVRGISVFALSGEPAWTFQHKAALAWAHRALALAPFDGLHLDVEPAALPHWRKHQQVLVADYLRLLDRLAPLGGPLEVDAQFAYGSITTPDGTFADDILSRVDAVTVMSYRDSAFGNNSTTAVAADWLQRAASAGKPVWLAAETNREPDCPSCTFYQEGQTRMAKVLGQVDTWAGARYPTYQGISIEDLDGWLALKP
jgi:hypothetical protein